MNKTRLKLRNTAAVAIAATVASTFVACSGDDNATTVPDSGSTASSSSSAQHDSGSSSSGSGSSANDASMEASSTQDSGSKTDSGDAATEAETSRAPVQALDWCSLLLFDFDDPPGSGTTLRDGGFSPNPCADDPECFANLMVTDFGNPQAFFGAIQADCHFGGLGPIVQAGSADGGSNSENAWVNQIIAFAIGLFGCTEADLGQIDAGDATIRDLLPPGQANQTLTQADVNALVNAFGTAVYSEVAIQDLVDSNGGTLLTADQVQELQDTLNAVAAATPNITPSLTTYTYDTCPTDAGGD